MTSAMMPAVGRNFAIGRCFLQSQGAYRLGRKRQLRAPFGALQSRLRYIQQAAPQSASNALGAS